VLYSVVVPRLLDSWLFSRLLFLAKLTKAPSTPYFLCLALIAVLSGGGNHAPSLAHVDTETPPKMLASR
jgi:hypothetical protein